MTYYEKKMQEMTLDKFAWLLALSTQCFECPLNDNTCSEKDMYQVDCMLKMKQMLESEVNDSE